MAGLKEAAAKLGVEAEKARNTKSTRLWFIVGIAVIVFALWWLKVLKTGFAIGLGIILLAAFGIETFNYDLDLGRLWQTGNIQESRVTHTKDGLKLMGSCALPTKWEGDLNCANFQTQGEAQAKYDQCANEIASYNQWTDAAKVKSLDIYGLDKNKNGIVCEALPGAPKEAVTKEDSATTTSTSQRNQVWKSTTTKETNASWGTYSKTPLLRTGNPYPATPASDRTNPKTLPAK